MTIREFENIYPSKLWVVVCNKDLDVNNILDQFTFFTTTGFLKQEVNYDIEDHLRNSVGDIVGETFAVMNKDTAEVGTMVIIYDVNSITEGTIPHESVHAADYFYEYTNQNGQSFSEGNEGYAYLVGWIASKVFNVIKEKMIYGKTK